MTSIDPYTEQSLSIIARKVVLLILMVGINIALNLIVIGRLFRW